MMIKIFLACLLLVISGACGMKVFPGKDELSEKAEVVLSYVLGGFDTAINNYTVAEDVKGKLKEHMDDIISAARTKDLTEKVKALTDKLTPAKEYLGTLEKDDKIDEKLQNILIATSELIRHLLEVLPNLKTAA